MRILVTNDDGIHAPGLGVAERIAAALSDDVWVVAPETDQSGVSHSLSLNDPLRLREVEARRFAIKGTPTDCVIMGLRHVLRDVRPDLVLSGVNRGQNVAEDVTYSGTVAGAMEGTILGVPSIALSQAYGPGGRNAIRWQCAEAHAPAVVRKILDEGIPASILVNVNFPDCEPGRGARHRGDGARAAHAGAVAHRRARRRPRQPLFLGRLRQGQVDPGERHRPLGARRPAHLGDAAAPRPHRRADADEIRGGVRLRRPQMACAGAGTRRGPASRKSTTQ